MRRQKDHIDLRHRRKGRLAPATYCIAIVILLFLLVLAIISCTYGRRVLGETAPPVLLGNKPETIANLEEERDDVHPFTFWVVSDTHRENYLRTLYPDQIKPQHPSFGIILGDVVLSPSKAQHRYFWNTCRRLEIDSPTMVVLGNHDVSESDPFDDPKYMPPAFDLEAFHEAYGPDQFSFTYAGCLFIVVNNSMGGEAYMDFMEDALEREAAGARMIFVICHLPFRTENEVAEYPAVYIPRFPALAAKYHIDYLITGHFHTYVRKTISGTTYLISGGGTGLFGRESYSLSHGVFFNVDPASRIVNERVMVVHEGPFRLMMSELDWIVVVIFAPYIQEHPLLSGVYFAVDLLLIILFCYGLAGNLRRKRADGLSPKRN